MTLTARWLLVGLAVALFAGREVYISHHYVHPSVIAPQATTAQVPHWNRCSAFAVSGHTATAGEIHDFDIPGGELRETMDCFIHESGLGEMYPAEMATSVTAPVQGRMSSLDAMKLMLEPTNLTVEESTQSGDHSIIFFYKESEASQS